MTQGSTAQAESLTVTRTVPAGAVRGTVLVLPGRGDDPSYYRRLAARLAVDGYASEIALERISSVDDVVSVWASEGDGVRVVVGVDTSAGLLATALAEGRLDPLPAGAVFAGTAVAGGDADLVDELSARSACPVHRGVVLEADAAPLRESAVEPTWPGTRADLPVLALHGAADRIAPVEPALALLEGWNADVVTIAGGLHDVLNDVHHRSVAAEIVTFLERLRLDAAAVPILERRRAD